MPTPQLLRPDPRLLADANPPTEPDHDADGAGLLHLAAAVATAIVALAAASSLLL